MTCKMCLTEIDFRFYLKSAIGMEPSAWHKARRRTTSFGTFLSVDRVPEEATSTAGNQLSKPSKACLCSNLS